MAFPHNVLSTHALSYLSPQELSHADEHAPQPLVDGEGRAGEGLPSKLNDDDLQNTQERDVRLLLSSQTLDSPHPEQPLLGPGHEEQPEVVSAHEEQPV